MSSIGNKALLRLIALLSAALPLMAFGQPEPLTLEKAIDLARTQNGGLKAQIENLRQQRLAEQRARSFFLPTVTPNFSYETGQSDFQTGRFRDSSSATRDTSLTIVSRYQLLDNGTRLTGLRGATAGRKAAEQDTIDFIRNTLVQVHARYFNMLRAAELLSVQEANRERALQILRQTEALIEQDLSAPIDRLQAEADVLNAEASVLTARTNVRNAEANLKSVIGWRDDEPLPPLVAPNVAPPAEVDFTLDRALVVGIEERADLKASRFDLETTRQNLRQSEIDRWIDFSVDLGYTRGFSEDVFDTSFIALTASVPLYDGNRSRILVEQNKAALRAREANLEQSELNARAEIEAAYYNLSIDAERLQATLKAAEAAEKNYEATQKSFELGVSDIVDVVVANATLVTARSNLVEARYDLLISEINFRFATGQAIPGERIEEL